MSLVSKKTAHDTITEFLAFRGHKREELPWLNGKTAGFPNRVHGFYDCALAVSYFIGMHPAIISCHVWRDYCLHNKTWHTDFNHVQQGDIVIFDWESAKGLGRNTNTDHIGLVVSVDPHKQTVTYVSADTGPVIPGIVTLNTVGAKWISGFGRPVTYAQPVSVVPNAVHPDQQAQHAKPAVTPVADAAKAV